MKTQLEKGKITEFVLTHGNGRQEVKRFKVIDIDGRMLTLLCLETETIIFTRI